MRQLAVVMSVLLVLAGCGSGRKAATSETNPPTRDGKAIVESFGNRILAGRLGSDHGQSGFSESGNAGWINEVEATAIGEYRSKEKIRSADLGAALDQQMGLTISYGLKDGNWAAAIMPNAEVARSLVAKRVKETSGPYDAGGGVAYWSCGADCADTGNVGVEFYWASGPAILMFALEWQDAVPLGHSDADKIAAVLVETAS